MARALRRQRRTPAPAATTAAATTPTAKRIGKPPDPEPPEAIAAYCCWATDTGSGPAVTWNEESPGTTLRFEPLVARFPPTNPVPGTKNADSEAFAEKFPAPENDGRRPVNRSVGPKIQPSIAEKFAPENVRSRSCADVLVWGFV